MSKICDTLISMSFQSQFWKYMSLRLESLLLAMPLLLFFALYHFYDALSIDPYFGVSVPFILSTNILIFHIPIFFIPYLINRFMRDLGPYLMCRLVNYGWKLQWLPISFWVHKYLCKLLLSFILSM